MRVIRGARIGNMPHAPSPTLARTLARSHVKCAPCCCTFCVGGVSIAFKERCCRCCARLRRYSSWLFLAVAASIRAGVHGCEATSPVSLGNRGMLNASLNPGGRRYSSSSAVRLRTLEVKTPDRNLEPWSVTCFCKLASTCEGSESYSSSSSSESMMIM